MPDSSQRFDPYLDRINADLLKKMVPAYGGHNKMRKQECIDHIRATLATPEKMRQAVNHLAGFEQLGLALAKQTGGALDYKTLGLGVLASGIEMPNSLTRRRRFESDTPKNIASKLLSRGLFLADGYSPASLSSYYSSRGQIFTDPRWLEHAGPVTVEPLIIQSAPKPPTTIVRMPPTVILELIGFLQTLDTMGGLGLTQKDELRVNDVKKFRKGLKWESDDLELDGLVFAGALNGLIQALRHSDFLEFKGQQLLLKRPVEDVASQGYAAQVSTMVDGFLRISEWEELGSTDRWIQPYGNHQQGRLALLLALTSLPQESDDFYTLDDFDDQFYARVGEHLSIRGTIQGPYYQYNQTPAEIKQIEAEWRVKRQGEWKEQERPWVEKVFTSWLYYLGMVELGMEGKKVVSFRLTELGKAVLNPAIEHSVETQSSNLASKNGIAEGNTTGSDATREEAAGSGTWIVQPNFDIVVYLDRTTPTQLAFLERHAERTQAQQYTAHYRLTRESVYRGLESGTSPAAFVEELALHAQADLPQNVLIEIQEWAALREQVILHHHAHLIEFPDKATRQQALDTGIAGRSIGDRFLLITPEVLKSQYQKQKAAGDVKQIDYARPLKQLLSVDESGLITLVQAPTDLFLSAHLDHWSERTKGGKSWQLTQASIAKRIKAGARIPELTTLLNKRLLPRHSIPLLLQTALHKWASKRTSAVELESFIILRCDDPAVVQAIVSSERFKPYLRGRLEDDLIAFDSSKIKEVRKILLWAGLELEEVQYW